MRTKIYLIAKKIHRLLVLIIIVISLLMMVTGLLLKYSFVATKLGLDLGQVRYVHNQLSPFFSLILLLMIGTGLIMYFFPLINRNKK